jgi:hypothetical protein
MVTKIKYVQSCICQCHCGSACTGCHCQFWSNPDLHHGRHSYAQQVMLNKPVPFLDGAKVVSTHMCDIEIPGIPITLTGHIIPNLSIDSLFGIHVLAKAGCMVTLNSNKCVVKFKGQEILRGYKDPSMNLWTPPLVLRHVQPPNMTMSCPCWPALCWPAPIHALQKVTATAAA